MSFAALLRTAVQKLFGRRKDPGKVPAASLVKLIASQKREIGPHLSELGNQNSAIIVRSV